MNRKRNRLELVDIIPGQTSFLLAQESKHPVDRQN